NAGGEAFDDLGYRLNSAPRIAGADLDPHAAHLAYPIRWKATVSYEVHHFRGPYPPLRRTWLVCGKLPERDEHVDLFRRTLREGVRISNDLGKDVWSGVDIEGLA